MIKIVIFGLVCGYLALAAVVYIFQRSLMYLPSGEAMPSASMAGVPEMMPVALRTPDGLSLTSWFSAPRETGGKIIVLFHGNAGTLAGRAFKARYFLDAGYGVMLVGYRGFSGNAGSPTEAGLYVDARTALGFVANEGITPENTVLYGESLGSGVAVQMAFEWAEVARNREDAKPYAGVVLEAPFTSMWQAAALHYPWLPAKYIVRDRYDSLNKIRSISAPLYVMHGGLDKTVPQDHGRLLYETARMPRQAHWIPHGGHVNLYEFQAAESLVEWLNSLKQFRLF